MIGSLADIITLISFPLTLGTLLAAINVRKHILNHDEEEEFRIKKDEIIGKIDGFELSLKNDNFFNTPNISDFPFVIQCHLVDIKSKYTFLSRRSMKIIKKLITLLDSSSLTREQWHTITKYLITLKNSLNKEV